MSSSSVNILKKRSCSFLSDEFYYLFYLEQKVTKNQIKILTKVTLSNHYLDTVVTAVDVSLIHQNVSFFSIRKV